MTDFATGDVLETEATDGEIRAKVGNAADGVGYFADAPFYSTDGFISRPNQPDANGDSCQALYIQDGNGRIILGTRDNRYADKVGTLDDGDRAIVTKGEARLLVKRATDAVVIMTKDKTTGKTMLQSLSGDAGEFQVFVGNCWLRITNDSISMSAGDGVKSSLLMINANGIHMLGGSFNCGMAGGHFGYIVPPIAGAPGIQPPLGVNSVVIGPTGLAGVASTKWTFSP